METLPDCAWSDGCGQGTLTIIRWVGLQISHMQRSGALRESRDLAVIDSRPFGGTCALRGCDPKKVLVGAAEALDWNRRMGEHGIRADQVGIDWPRLIQFKRSFTESVPKNSEESFVKI